MHLIYIDDSKDEVLGVFSALAIPVEQWRTCFDIVRAFRRELKQSDGVYVQAEFHAWKLVSGRGKISDQVVGKARRCEIFKEALVLVSQLPGARLFNVVYPKKDDLRAFEWLLNRINRTMVAWDSHALLICDEGKDIEYTRLARQMGIYNPIPSQVGYWEETGQETRSIPIDRVIEDPIFKRSDRSYFIQLADLCAYALLRRERPVESKSRYGLHQAFGLLRSILVLEARRSDPEGIIRVPVDHRTRR